MFPAAAIAASHLSDCASVRQLRVHWCHVWLSGRAQLAFSSGCGASSSRHSKARPALAAASPLPSAFTHLFSTLCALHYRLQVSSESRQQRTRISLSVSCRCLLLLFDTMYSYSITIKYSRLSSLLLLLISSLFAVFLLLVAAHPHDSCAYIMKKQSLGVFVIGFDIHYSQFPIVQ